MPEPVSFGSLIANLFPAFGTSDSGASAFAELARFAASIWLMITVISFVVAAAALVVIVYATVRIFDLRKREGDFYGTLLAAPERGQRTSPRWQRIEELAGSEHSSAWREAIIEADIMLDDLLSRQGYAGEGVAEKLRQVERSDMASLEDAWEAHRVRNQVAHQGSAFDLSPTLAQRTIARYERVFREFNVI
jgi:hypothetical protein